MLDYTDHSVSGLNTLLLHTMTTHSISDDVLYLRTLKVYIVAYLPNLWPMIYNTNNAETTTESLL